MNTLDFSGVRNVNDLMDVCGTHNNLAGLLEALGSFQRSGFLARRARMAYPAAFSTLTDDALSDANAYWNNELACATELAGAIDAQRTLAGLMVKREQYKARTTVRGNYLAGGVKLPAAGVINEEAETVTAVTEAQDQALILDVAYASIKGYIQACAGVVAGISREISFRQDHLRAGVRG